MRDETSPKWQIWWTQTRCRKNHRKTAHWSTNRRFRSLFSSCPFYGQHITRSSRTHHQKKRYAIRKAKEAFLISKGKTLEPIGLNRTWGNLIYLFFLFLFLYPFWYTLTYFSIFVYQSHHLYFLHSAAVCTSGPCITVYPTKFKLREQTRLAVAASLLNKRSG